MPPKRGDEEAKAQIGEEKAQIKAEDDAAKDGAGSGGAGGGLTRADAAAAPPPPGGISSTYVQTGRARGGGPSASASAL